MSSEARGCLFAIGWVYVGGLFLALVFIAWGRLSFDRESFYGILLAVAWPLSITFFAGGHGAPTMPPWARAVVLPLAVGWIALGWWAMIAACRWWIK